MVTENEDAFCDAVKADLGKPESETKMMELVAVANECVEMLEHLDEWSKPHKPSVGALYKMDGCQIRREPLGVVLIIGAFNYPIQLSLMPVAGAIAGGNAVVVTPSEASGASAKLMADLATRLLITSFRILVSTCLLTMPS